MRDIVGELKAHNTSLVAITPQIAEHSVGMREKNKLDFPILSDPGNGYASKLGLTFAFSDALKKVFDGFKVDLAKVNGEGSWTMPMPARLVVDRGGIVRAADIDPDYTKRPEPEKTLADVIALG
ncbi:MAG: redoxin domain-containing protein [Rhodospirillaceae bacterium]|nr:redoxin domain-containing protein [Rhodospirillaceae bacterium]